MAIGQPSQAVKVRQQAEQLAAVLPPLLVEAERIASTVAQGVHGRRRVGTGDAFWQYRRYQPGDAASQIDWRQSAKRQRYYVRQNEWELAESIWLWRDGSPSMAWHSDWSATDKSDRATLLLLALASLLVRGGERVALLGEGRLPSTGRVTLDRLAQTLLLPRGNPLLNQSLPSRVPLPRDAQVVLIGDFLSPLGELESSIRSFAGDGVRGHLLQIMDPAEEDLPYQGRTRFQGMEGERTLLISRVETLRDAWKNRLAERDAALRDLARRTGWSFARHRTDRPPQTALLALYAALSGGLSS